VESFNKNVIDDPIFGTVFQDLSESKDILKYNPTAHTPKSRPRVYNFFLKNPPITFNTQLMNTKVDFIHSSPNRILAELFNSIKIVSWEQRIAALFSTVTESTIPTSSWSALKCPNTSSNSITHVKYLNKILFDGKFWSNQSVFNDSFFFKTKLISFVDAEEEPIMSQLVKETALYTDSPISFSKYIQYNDVFDDYKAALSVFLKDFYFNLLGASENQKLATLADGSISRTYTAGVVREHTTQRVNDLFTAKSTVGLSYLGGHADNPVFDNIEHTNR